ncbi:MAG: hypothetical protein CL599_12650 [Alteromonas sp.]|nr:hypothetical protein [Alteromonas sp.]OUX85936.1 MAG: hypothetical protein CBB95_12300 [Alteromonas sp. TMED35]
MLYVTIHAFFTRDDKSFFLIISKIIAPFYLRATLFIIKTYFERCVSTNNALIRNAMLPVCCNSGMAPVNKSSLTKRPDALASGLLLSISM